MKKFSQQVPFDPSNFIGYSDEQIKMIEVGFRNALGQVYHLERQVFRSEDDNGWTKQQIVDQLDRDGETVDDITADDLSAEQAQNWVNSEFELRNDDLDEEAYVDAIIEHNTELLKQLRSRGKDRG